MTDRGRRLRNARKINKVRKYDSIVGLNVLDYESTKEKRTPEFEKAYREFKRKPYGME